MLSREKSLDILSEQLLVLSHLTHKCRASRLGINFCVQPSGLPQSQHCTDATLLVDTVSLPALISTITAVNWVEVLPSTTFVMARRDRRKFKSGCEGLLSFKVSFLKFLMCWTIIEFSPFSVFVSAQPGDHVLHETACDSKIQQTEAFV